MSNKSYTTSISDAVVGIQKIQSFSNEERKKWFPENGPLPPNIPLGDGKMLFITQDGLHAIHEFGLLWRSQDSDRKRRLNDERARKLVVDAFGEALARDNWMNKTDDEKAKDVQEILENHLKAAGHGVIHSYPCQIFEDTSAGKLTVGSVCFWPKLEWLDYIKNVAGQEKQWMEDVRSAWTNSIDLPEDNEKLKHPAYSIIKGFASCSWVATVTIEGNEIGRSKERAQASVRLAINALGLLLPRYHALKLRGPGDELRAKGSINIHQVYGFDPAIGVSMDLPVIHGTSETASSFVKNTDNFRKASGESIEAIIEASTSVKLPKLKQRWCDALFWFGEARRDVTEFTALVRYGMVLDILAKGKGTNGIITLVSSLFEHSPDDPFLNDGTTLKKTIKRIYEEGRSQFGHGGRPALLEDLPFPRDAADQLTSEILSRYVLCLNLFTGSDKYEDFLRDIPQLVPRLSA